MQVQGPLIVALAGVIGFLDAGGRQLVRLERFLAQVARLPRKLARLRVTPSCTSCMSVRLKSISDFEALIVVPFAQRLKPLHLFWVSHRTPSRYACAHRDAAMSGAPTREC